MIFSEVDLLIYSKSSPSAHLGYSSNPWSNAWR